MANQLLTSTIISNTFLAEFVTSNKFVNIGTRRLMTDVNNSAGYKTNDTIQIRRRNRAKIGLGSVATPQDIIDATETLTINKQYHALFSLTSKETLLSLENFREQVVRPVITELNAKISYDVVQSALTDVTYANGDPTTPLNAFSKVRDTQALMNQLMMPTDKRYMGISETAGGDIESSLSNFFNTKLNNPILFEGYMGRLSGFEFFTDQAINNHTAGTAAQAAAGSITVNGTVSSGSVVVLAGAPNSQVVFNAGDVITFKNGLTFVNSVTPAQRWDTGRPMTFTVTAPATSDGSGNVSVSIAPAIISDTNNVRQNVTAAIGNGAVVGLPTNYEANLAFCADALDFICPPLPDLDVKMSKVAKDTNSNISIRIASQGDIVNDVNMHRMDVLVGYKWHPEYAVKQLSSR